MRIVQNFQISLNFSQIPLWTMKFLLPLIVEHSDLKSDVCFQHVCDSVIQSEFGHICFIHFSKMLVNYPALLVCSLGDSGPIIAYIYHVLWLTMTYFTASSILVT